MFLRSKQKHIISLALLIIVTVIFTKGYLDEKKKIHILSPVEYEDSNEVENYSNEITSISTQRIKIHIEGAVKNPGLYELPLDSRVNDAINIAGGLLNDADRKRINLSKKIVDEEFIYILVEGEENEVYEVTNTESDGLVNINIASKQELESLIGIGPALADRIINYRNEKGKFSSIEEIMNVKGIGEKKYEELSSKITIN